MGTRGPVGKRSDEKLGHTTKAAVSAVSAAPGALSVTVPPVNVDWHPIALRWFEALGQSGQSRFYEPSDWAVAYLVAESMSRDLGPQVVGVTERGDVVKDVIPLKGASLAAYMKACSVLGATEGDRRRMQIELHRAKPEASDDVIVLDDWRVEYG